MEEQTVFGQKQDENKRLSGLQYARSLNFTDAQYEEAMRRIVTFDNANQLLVALLDVSSASESTHEKMGTPAQEHVQNGAPSYGSVDILLDEEGSKPVAEPNESPFIHRRTQITATNSCDTTTSVSSASQLSTSGFASAENQSSLECLSTISHDNNNQVQQIDTHIMKKSSKIKLERSRSHQPTTSTATAANATSTDLRIIHIDGSNVARTHGRDVTFSWQGIKLCADWFRRRGHKVKVYLPEDKCEIIGSTNAANILNYLNQIEALIKTPFGCSDDKFIIEAARLSNGLIVSNDLYRYEKRSNTDLKKFISLNRLPYIFVDDLFIPASDPLGRAGPNLDEFLRVQNNSSQAMISQKIHKQSLHRTKSHQRQWQ